MRTIYLDIARRCILGKQGLWPGRRWCGIRGAERAPQETEFLQLGPLQVVARSHDIALRSRVLDYTSRLWEHPAHRKRKFFDWGGWLATRPMDERGLVSYLGFEMATRLGRKVAVTARTARWLCTPGGAPAK